MTQTTLDTTSPGKHTSRKCEWCWQAPGSKELLWRGHIRHFCVKHYHFIQDQEDRARQERAAKAKRTRAGK